MKGNILTLLVVLFCLPGCVEPMVIEPVTQEQQDQESKTVDEGPYNINAPLLNSSQGNFDILENSNGNNTLLIWVAAGCSGCHDWTEMVSESLSNGSMSNQSNIVSIHRYPSFESNERLQNTYGNESKSTYTPWPLITPSDGDLALNASTGNQTSVTIVEAYDQPVTPTLQIIDSQGYIIWQSATYWADYEVIEEITTLI